jgi:hypothetical protein
MKNYRAIFLLATTLLFSSCGQNAHITMDEPTDGGALSALSVSLNSFSSFTYTYDQQNSLPDLSWQIIDNNTAASYAGILNYQYAVGTLAVGATPGASSAESSERPWQSTGSGAPSVGSGIQGLSPGVYYMNLQAIDPATGDVVSTDSVRFEILARGSSLPAVAVNGPAGGASTAAGASETITGSCSPNGVGVVTVSGASLVASVSGNCTNGAFSVSVTMNGSLPAGSQPQINITNGAATAAVVLNVPQASAPSVAITGPSSSTYNNSLGMGATSPQDELVVTCTSGDTINVSGEISGVSPAVPAVCPVSGVLNFSFNYAENGVSGAAGPRLVQVSATNGAGLTSYDSATYNRTPGAPTITAPAVASTVGLMSTVTGACVEGAVVSLSNSNLSPNPTTGICASNNTYSIPIEFTALTTGSQVLSATQTAAGLTSTATTSNVMVDNTRPSLSMAQASPHVGHNGSSSAQVIL